MRTVNVSDASVVLSDLTSDETTGGTTNGNRPPSITRALIHLDRLRANSLTMQAAAAPASLIAVVKADAYGHGAVQCARILVKSGIDFLAVATLAEAERLRSGGIEVRILVLASPLEEQLPWYRRLGVEITVARLDLLHAVLRNNNDSDPLKCHVKIDTGMGRIGLSPEEFRSAATLLRENNVTVTAIWTHYANADDPNDPLTKRQETLFYSLVHGSGISAEVVHLMNTGSLIAGRGSTPTGDYVRVGISLYGATGFQSYLQSDLKPVMTLCSKIVQIKSVPKGTGVSYGHRWVADADTRIATVGAGYADGYPRTASSTARVGINGALYPIAGTVCMDMFMVDIGTNTSISEGDDVILWGAGGPSADELAQSAGTIPYDLFCRVSARVPRVYSDSN